MSEDGGIFRLRDSGVESLDTIVPVVLRHLSEEVIDAVVGNMRETLGRNRLRFAGVRAVAERGAVAGATLAAGYLQEYPGKIAGMAGPRIVAGSKWDDEASLATAQRLIEIGQHWSLEMVQVILEPGAPFSRSILEQAGMRKAADLVQMERTIHSEEPGSLESPSEDYRQSSVLSWRAYLDSDREKWLSWLDRTYIETSDCPLLNGIRSTQATLEGYEATSKINHPNGRVESAVETDRPAWMGAFVQDGLAERLMAAYILSPTDSETWELTYMGVDPDFRGKGFGRETLSRAVGHVRRLGGRRLWLAVDDLNVSAKRLYGEFNFTKLRRLEAWIAAPVKTIDGTNSGVGT